MPAIRPRPTIMSMRCGANVMIAPSTAHNAITTIDVVLCETSPKTSTEIPRIGIAASSSTNMTRAASHLLGRCPIVRGMRSAIALGSGLTATSTMRCRTVLASMPLTTGGNGLSRLRRLNWIGSQVYRAHAHRLGIDAGDGSHPHCLICGRHEGFLWRIGFRDDIHGGDLAVLA